MANIESNALKSSFIFVTPRNQSVSGNLPIKTCTRRTIEHLRTYKIGCHMTMSRTIFSGFFEWERPCRVAHSNHVAVRNPIKQGYVHNIDVKMRGTEDRHHLGSMTGKQVDKILSSFFY